MLNKAQIMGVIVTEILKRVDEHYYKRNEHRPIPYVKLRGCVGRQAEDVGGFDSIVKALVEDKSIKLVTTETGKQFVAPPTAKNEEIQPVKFWIE